MEPPFQACSTSNQSLKRSVDAGLRCFESLAIWAIYKVKPLKKGWKIGAAHKLFTDRLPLACRAALRLRFL
jgi:hypothetical protein